MSLATEVVARIPNPLLVQQTNRGSNTASTVNSTVLAEACEDVSGTGGAFETYVGLTYDSTLSAHNRIAVPFVLATLRMWTLGVPTSEEYEACIRRAKDYARISSRDRFPPTSSSQLTPSTEVPSGEEVRPHFDDDAFDGYRPNQP